MPELPEVEHARCTLAAWLKGRTITRARGSATHVFRGSSAAEFERALTGRSLVGLTRRGKYLLLAFDGDVGVLSHLGMTGKWVRRAPGPATGRRTVPRHSCARLELDDGHVLHYCDPRLFGRLTVHRGAPLTALPEIRALGPDPLHDGVDPAALHAALARTSRAVKVAIMDQRVLAGVGNIYATEALFRAGIHPARPGRSASLAEAGRLAEGIVASMAGVLEAIADVGAVAYLSEGSHVENPFLVYGRSGSPCPRCGRILESLILGGRTSTFCPGCQR